MVRKLVKSRSRKATTSTKAAPAKSEVHPLSNGHAESENEQIEDTTEGNAHQPEPEEPLKGSVKPETSQKLKISAEPKGKKQTTKAELKSEKGSSAVVQESTSVEVAEQQKIEDDVFISSQSAPKASRKRKPVETEVKKTAAKTKAKKQKVLLEVPTISSVSGKVFVIGENDVGQLGLGEDIPEKTRPALLELPHSIVDVAAGGMHSVCLTENGEIFTFGCNDEGALGREGSEDIPGRVDIPERIIQVSAGDSHTAALSDSGQVYIWGNFRNNNGQMGLVSPGSSQRSPVRILDGVTVVKITSGSEHLVCLSQEGTIYTCGSGDAGQLGRMSPNTCTDGGRRGRISLLTPDKVQITRSNKNLVINNVWTGSYATFANVQESDLIYVFGLNNYNQLGLQNNETIMRPTQVPSFNNKHWQQINGGQHHTLALDDKGLIHSLGRHDYGRLGLGEDCNVTGIPTEIPTLQDKVCVDISCGNVVSFAVTDNGSVFSWGMGTNNQLGHGNDDDQHTPLEVRGNFLNSWKSLKVSGGGQHTLILATPRGSSENSQ